MKHLATSLLLGLISVALAGPANWVEVPTASANKIYLDTANALTESFVGIEYTGFRVRIVFTTPGTFQGTGLTTTYTVVSEIAEVVYNCRLHSGTGRRLQFTDDQNAEHAIDDIWRTLDHGVALDISSAVAARVCPA